jgi:glycosyltransferase involved in cell wall biosynthesis
MTPGATGCEERAATTPLVGVVIPCFNQAAFLFDCLNSLMAQTEVRWQAIVVDDCSREDVIDRIVASYHDSRVSSIRHRHNEGLAESRNTGLRATAAPYLLPLDADDLLHPRFLEATLAQLQQRERDCVWTDFQLVGLSDDIWRWPVKTADDMAVAQWIPGPGTLMRRAVWERVGGYCAALRWNEDWDFWIGALDEDLKVGHVAEPLYYYRRHQNSMSVSPVILHDWETRELIAKRHPQFFAGSRRRATFLSGGYFGSALGELRSGHYAAFGRLARHAIVIKPRLAIPLGRSLASTLLQSARRFTRGGRPGVSGRPTPGLEDTPGPDDGTVGSDAAHGLAPGDYASHDYGLLDEIVSLTAARSVLEIGCGRGRLMPVYLKQGLRPIWAQDRSRHALDLCRRRFPGQSDIRYFHGPALGLPGDCRVDLVVSAGGSPPGDDAERRQILKDLARRTRAIFVNAPGSKTAPPATARTLESEAAHILPTVGFTPTRQGTLIGPDGTARYWRLFVNDRRG